MFFDEHCSHSFDSSKRAADGLGRLSGRPLTPFAHVEFTRLLSFFSTFARLWGESRTPTWPSHTPESEARASTVGANLMLAARSSAAGTPHRLMWNRLEAAIAFWTTTCQVKLVTQLTSPHRDSCYVP